MYIVQACKQLDHANFDFEALAASAQYSSVADWINSMEKYIEFCNSTCMQGLTNDEVYLRDYSSGILWVGAGQIYRQCLDKAHISPDSKPGKLGRSLMRNLESSAPTIIGLLNEMVERRQLDVQMQRVFRRKWIILDWVLDDWYGSTRKTRCTVPSW